MTAVKLILFTLLSLTCAVQAQEEDQTTLIQNRVLAARDLFAGKADDANNAVEHGPSMVQHQTHVEVDLPNTKVVAGVPIYNYQFAHPSGLNPSALQIAEAKNWTIFFPEDYSDEKIAEFCKDPPGNSTCEYQGHPTEGGIAFAEYSGTNVELQAVLHVHPALKPRFVEPDVEVSPIPEIPVDNHTSVLETSGEIWGLDRIDGRSGLDGSYSAPLRSKEGAGAHIYIADTGIRTTHEDFEGRAIPTIDTTTGKVIECNGAIDCAYDTNGHGTHCAGTAGGKKWGVAKKATLYAVKVLNPNGLLSNILKSIDWVASKGNKPAIWSASLGGSSKMHAYESAFTSAIKHGVTVVVAAGNANYNACYFSPAFAPSAITVGATDANDKRASFSNYGSCVDIFAPGTNIRSASHHSNYASSSKSGTSMACPHVSGAAALFLADNPWMTPADVMSKLTADATSGLVKDSKGTANYLLYIGKSTTGAIVNTTVDITAIDPDRAFAATVLKVFSGVFVLGSIIALCLCS